VTKVTLLKDAEGDETAKLLLTLKSKVDTGVCLKHKRSLDAAMYLDIDMSPAQLKERSERVGTMRALKADKVQGVHWRGSDIFIWDEACQEAKPYTGQYKAVGAAIGMEVDSTTVAAPAAPTKKGRKGTSSGKAKLPAQDTKGKGKAAAKDTAKDKHSRQASPPPLGGARSSRPASPRRPDEASTSAAGSRPSHPARPGAHKERSSSAA
jgi:hypothetical protein